MTTIRNTYVIHSVERMQRFLMLEKVACIVISVLLKGYLSSRNYKVRVSAGAAPDSVA
jgi:hypothetical protein